MNLRRLQCKRTGKGRRGLLVAALLLAVCTVFVLARRAMMNTLLRHATRYAEVGEWSRVFLLSDHEALVLLPPYSEALRVDIRTGRKEPIAPLSTQLD